MKYAMFLLQCSSTILLAAAGGISGGSSGGGGINNGGGGSSSVGTVTNLVGTNGITVTPGDPIVITQDGTLATGATVLQTNISRSRYINVLDYGVIADGVTTNTTTFNNAFNAGSVSNLPVRIPSGDYIIGTLTLPSSNVVIFGDGMTTRLIPKRGSFSTALPANAGGAFISDLWLDGNNRAGTNNSFATNATPPTSIKAIAHNADGPGGVRNVRITGFTTGLEIIGTDSILTRPQQATYDDIFITNCTIGLVTTGPNNAEYTTFSPSLQVVNCWGGWSNATAANIKWKGGVIRDCPGFTYWQKGTTNTSFGYRGHSFINPYWTHSGEVILENANNVTFEGGQISCGGQVMGQNVSGAIRLNATTNAIFNNLWIGEVSGATGNMLIFTNGGSFNQFNNIRVPVGGGTNIIGATAANSSGWNVRSDEFGTLLQPASTWSGVTLSGTLVNNGDSLFYGANTNQGITVFQSGVTNGQTVIKSNTITLLGAGWTINTPNVIVSNNGTIYHVSGNSSLALGNGVANVTASTGANDSTYDISTTTGNLNFKTATNRTVRVWSSLTSTNGYYFASGQGITNAWTTNITIDFASTSVGSIAQASFNLTEAANGDTVIVTPPSSVSGIIGMWTGWATNGLIGINFIPTATAQDPVSGSYRVVVEKWK
jgi:hypothetical protein